jgi:hypothetical protein
MKPNDDDNFLDAWWEQTYGAAAEKIAKLASIPPQNEDEFYWEMGHALEACHNAYIVGFYDETIRFADFRDAHKKVLAARDAIACLPERHRRVLEIQLLVRRSPKFITHDVKLEEYVEYLVEVLARLAGGNPKPKRGSKVGRRKGSVADWHLQMIMSEVFAVTKRYGGDLSFNKHKDGGGDEFREAWAVLQKLFPSVLPETLAEGTVSTIDRIKWPPKNPAPQ